MTRRGGAPSAAAWQALQFLAEHGPVIMCALESRARALEEAAQRRDPPTPAAAAEAFTEQAAKARQIARRIAQIRWEEFVAVTDQMRGGLGPFSTAPDARVGGDD